jgi:hypothetical protein
MTQIGRIGADFLFLPERELLLFDIRTFSGYNHFVDPCALQVNYDNCEQL